MSRQTQRWATRSLVGGLAGAIAFSFACTVGVRATGELEADVELGGSSSVMLDLPSTAVSIRGCDRTVPSSCPDAVQLTGRWHAVGATRSQARQHAQEAALAIDSGAGIVRISTDVPLDIEGLVDLELDEMTMPSDLAVDVRTGLGDVNLRALTGSVVVDTDRGDVDIRGEMRSTGVYVQHGQVVVVGSGAVDVEARDGGVRVEQTAGAAETSIRAPAGDVELVLDDDADVDLRVETPGRIRVQTDAFSAVTTDVYRARSGTGAVQVEVSAGGDVVVRLAS